jgi:hypothetical protein
MLVGVCVCVRVCAWVGAYVWVGKGDDDTCLACACVGMRACVRACV